MYPGVTTELTAGLEDLARASLLNGHQSNIKYQWKNVGFLKTRLINDTKSFIIKTNSLKRILNYTPFLSVLSSRCDSAGLIQQIQNNFLGSLDKGIESLSQTFIFQSLYLCSPMSWTLVILNYYELLDQKKCWQQINTLGLLHLKPLLIHPIFFPNPFISHFKMLF